MGVKISEAGIRDALPILALHRAVLEERDYFITAPEEMTVSLEQKTSWILDVRDSDNAAILCSRAPMVTGFVSVIGGSLRRMRHTAKLEIMVDSGHRGSGVGRALMEAAVTWAIANEYIEKIGLSVFATNERAIGLYSAMGFEIEGRRAREYRLGDGTYRDDILMYRYV